MAAVRDNILSPQLALSEQNNQGRDTDFEKNMNDSIDSAHDSNGHDLAERSQHKQDGVKRVEAITQVWSGKVFVLMVVFLWLVAFIDQLLGAVQGPLIPYITSSFGQHGLLAATDIVATILGGVVKLTIAKLIDIWGRAEGFAVMVIFTAIGTVMKATCQNVETYSAANTIYWIGHLGVQYVITIIFTDITTLQNRIILFSLLQLPIICTVFAGPAIAQLFYEHLNFRWAFGAFDIIFIVSAIPVLVLFFLSKRKAIKTGIYPARFKSRSIQASIIHYCVEFDVVGMFLTTAGCTLFLLPFSLAGTAPEGWRTGYIIAMIAVGAVLIGAFVVWERFFAPVTYFPFKYLKNRTMLGACLLYAFMFTSTFVWDTYYGSYLQVVNNESITVSGYVLNAFSLMASFIAPFVGLYIRYTGDYYWLSLFSVPISLLGTALLIYFRQPDTSVGYLVMCQLFNGFATGVWVLTAQLAIMTQVSHQEVAVAIAIFGFFGSIGAAVGVTVAGAMWTQILYNKLIEFLPADAKDQAAIIYSSLAVQLGYPMGSPIREAIIKAYGDVMRKMAIVGSCFIPICFVCILVWRNINVKMLDKDKGAAVRRNVF